MLFKSMKASEASKNPFLKVSPRDRRGILVVFSYLASVDGKITEEERVFLHTVSDQLAIQGKRRDRAITEGQDTFTVGKVKSKIRTKWVRAMVLHQALLLVLVDNLYCASERSGIISIARAMGFGLADVEKLEAGIASDYTNLAKKRPSRLALRSSKDKAENRWNTLRILYAGGFVAGSAALMAITGGAAAPAVGGLLGSLQGLSGAAAVSSGLASLGGGSLAAGGAGVAGGTALVSTVFGLAGTAASAKAIRKRFAGLDDFSFIKIGGKSIATTILVNGFLTQRENDRDVWSCFDQYVPHHEYHALKWDSQSRRELGAALQSAASKILVQGAVGSAGKVATRLAGRMVAVPSMCLQMISMLGNPWHVASDRAIQTGKALAEFLIKRGLGERPVSLIGFSLGSRVIAETLLELKKQGAGNRLVHNVILMGGALSHRHAAFKVLDEVVAGNVVNAYCSTDYVLKYLFQAVEQKRPIGLGVARINGVFDLDVSSCVSGHLDYGINFTSVITRVRQALDEIEG